jgi:hypothetical protein
MLGVFRYADCMGPVLVRGDGVAAYCCVHLLQSAGIPVAIDRPSRPRVPAIMLSEAAVLMISDVFGRTDLFRGLPRVRSRSVLWGAHAEAVTLPHSAVVVSEAELLDQLRPKIEEPETTANPQWNIFAARPLPPESVEHGFGSRTARAFSVEMKDGAHPSCWAESVEDGWLFMIGSGNGKGWLLAVGSSMNTSRNDKPLERSRLIGPQVDRIDEHSGEFPAFPRIVAPLCGAAEQSWLACGTAAMAFDPLCGDGTAYAVREAILAVAVIRALADGVPMADLFAHYNARLTAGFHRHLTECAGFYRSGGTGDWWRAEYDAVERGLKWCSERMSAFPAFRFRLSGFALEAVK